jgi:hypothetical protein
MPVLSEEELASRIVDFVQQRGSCLFAGAGVGKRAGLPTWLEHLEYLASVAGRYEKETEVLMRKRLKTRHYLEAAGLYKECIEIPEGEKYRELVFLFTSPPNYSPNRLRALMALPFSAVVTTNYDRSLHDAYYNLFERQKESGLTLKAPKHVELGDSSMRQAIFWTDFYIARIHGRAEIPQTMVFDRNDYRRTERDPFYQDFLLHILKSYHCLFAGYSFVDPAINRVLQVMRDTLPQPYPQLHLALLPSDCDPRLRAQLATYNIEVVEYDPVNEHNSLWESIRAAQREIRTLSREAPDKVEPIPGLKRFLASCYARLKLGTRAEPLREIVVEGIAAQAIIDSGPQGTTRKALIQSLKKYLSLDDSQLARLVTQAVNGLMAQGLCTEEQESLTYQPDSQRAFDIALETLVESVTHRLKVREGVDADYQLRRSIAEILNRLLMTRGWDLGAHFAGGHPSSTFEAWAQIQAILKSFAKDISPNESSAVANAIFDLLRHPEDKEAELLADVGRVAFGVELILNNARSTVEQVLLTPGKVYLDASVLMPAIVDGHPYSPLYTDAISRMQNVAETAGSVVDIFIAKVFLNEIVTHRALASQEVYRQGFEDVDKLRRHILMCGAQGTNVYIGAYASWVGRTEERVSFAEFLAKVAPYGSEDGLATYLQEQGIRTITLSFKSGEEKDCYNQVRRALHSAYEDAADFDPYYRKPKPSVLINHEAAMLTRLVLDMEAGRKPLFVTADRRLMGLCQGPILGRCANAMVSHLGFIQLVDLVFGIETDRRALARLIWSIGRGRSDEDERIAIRNYLIDVALQHYDDALAMAMWEVVDKFSDEAAAAAKAEGISMFPENEDSRARTAAFLDRFEQDFFKNMAEVIKRREMEA